MEYPFLGSGQCMSSSGLTKNRVGAFHTINDLPHQGGPNHSETSSAPMHKPRVVLYHFITPTHTYTYMP